PSYRSALRYGDLRDLHSFPTRRSSDLTRIESVLEMAEQLQAIAPTYVVLGNHEADSPVLDELLRGLETVGVVVLRDEAVTLEVRSEEHTSELQSRENLVCRLLLEKKKK